MIEFTLTAMRRPDILRQTLDSFASKLSGVGLASSTLFLNVDPAPEGSTEDTVAVACGFFGSAIVNTPTEPCFPAAVKWCWSQPQSEYFFALEDDWILSQPIDVADMLAMLQADPSLSVVNLRGYRSGDDGRICLAPGLWRTAHARVIAERLVMHANPEMQLRSKRANNPFGGAHEGFKGAQYPKQVVLRDIGRAWMTEHGFKRAGGRGFVAWSK